MSTLMDKRNLCTMLLVTTVLSQKVTNSLGNWEVPWQYDPRAIEAEERQTTYIQKID